jgi:hypothetical protein
MSEKLLATPLPSNFSFDQPSPRTPAVIDPPETLEI